MMEHNNEPRVNRSELSQSELLKQAQHALAEHAVADKSASAKQSILVKTLTLMVRVISKVWYVITRTVAWLNYLLSSRNPVLYGIKIGAIWLAYVPDSQYPGELTFCARRLGKNSAWIGALGLAVYIAITAAYFYGTQFEELVYTTGKQEIVAGEQYQFTGCTSLPCSTQADNGKYYKVESSHFLPALYYPEEDVYANIPQQDGACLVKGYGFYFRSLRSLYKYFQWYQKAFDVSCRPYTEAEKQLAIGSGEIQKVKA
ncbi:hypothetical protein [Motilimonas eburnea]|uniref:hypothetical protein n=1 Tax=Motilimonas eburnea TaxID=1737488 RepID=UPI001E58D3CB|nr:hypothetical protein [Motilimonas eburnea]MCE2571886.1 hypothetical protein [Motilimonas eburnea]